jgi:hypothetical protein
MKDVRQSVLDVVLAYIQVCILVCTAVSHVSASKASHEVAQEGNVASDVAWSPDVAALPMVAVALQKVVVALQKAWLQVLKPAWKHLPTVSTGGQKFFCSVPGNQNEMLPATTLSSLQPLCNHTVS